MRQAATEPAGYSEKVPGELEYELKKSQGTKYPKGGVFECVGCGAPLYSAISKFDSGLVPSRVLVTIPYYVLNSHALYHWHTTTTVQ